MFTRDEYNAAMLVAPPVPLTERYMRDTIAARSEPTVRGRIACAAYLDAIVIQNRGGMSDADRVARIRQWSDLAGELRYEAALAELLIEGSFRDT